MNKLYSIPVFLLSLAGALQAQTTLELANDELLGDLGTAGTATGFNSITITLYSGTDFTTFSTADGGEAISFDLTINASPNFLTQNNNGMGVATGATGTASDIFRPLTFSIDNVSGASSVVMTQARFGGVFGSDSMTANELTITTANGQNNPTWDFADSTSLVLNALDNETGSMRIEAITFEATVIPEPSTYALIAGVLGLGCVVARRRK